MESICGLGRTCILLVKKIAGLERHHQGQQSLQEDYLMQSHGAMAFSEELCPLFLCIVLPSGRGSCTIRSWGALRVLLYPG